MSEEIIIDLEEQSADNNQYNRSKRRLSNIGYDLKQLKEVSCFRKGLNHLFCMPNEEKDMEVVYENIFALIIVLVYFLQQLSLLIVDDVEYGIWGDIFENIKFLSLNVNIEFQDLSSEIEFLVAVYMVPYALRLWSLAALNDFVNCFQKIPLQLQLSFKKLKIIIYLFALILPVLALIFRFVVGVGEGLPFLYPIGVIYLTMLGKVVRDKVIKSLSVNTTAEAVASKRSF